MQLLTCRRCGARNRVDESRLAKSNAKCGNCGNTLNSSNFSSTEAKPIIVSDATFEQEVMSITGRPVLLDCWAPWCGPCRVVGPIMDQLAGESQGRYRIAKLNVDENPNVASRYQIASIPTMLIFKDGKLIDRLIGAQPKHTIADRLKLASHFGARA